MATLTEAVHPPPGPGAGALIEFQRVSRAFGRTLVLDQITFQVRFAETKVLLGESGSGKTVILKLAMGLLRPSRGTVTVLGERVDRMRENQLFELRRRIGFVFQESALFDSMSVRDNVAYRLVEEGKLDADAIEERVRACLATVELEATLDKMPDELSGGMRRRVAIARALATEPEIMLYDSPTGGLDPVTASTIMELIIKLRDVNKVTGLLVTHRLQDAAMLATRTWDARSGQARAAAPENSHTSVLLLRDERVIFDGSAQDFHHNDDPYIQQFLAE